MAASLATAPEVGAVAGDMDTDGIKYISSSTEYVATTAGSTFHVNAEAVELTVKSPIEERIDAGCYDNWSRVDSKYPSYLEPLPGPTDGGMGYSG